MKNAINLTNFPKDIIERLVSIYESGNIEKVNVPNGEDKKLGLVVYDSKLATSIVIDPFFSDIKDIRPYYLVFNNKGRCRFHIDISRYCTVNIPIHNTNGPLAFSKYDNIKAHNDEILFSNTSGDAPGISLRYNKNSYFFNSMKVPVVLNTKMPHGFFNLVESPRVVFSIGFYNTKYEELLEIIPKEWF